MSGSLRPSSSTTTAPAASTCNTHTHTHTHTGDLTVGEQFVATLLTLPLADLSVVQILQSCSGSGRSVFVSARGILEGAELILTQNLQHSKPPVGDGQCGGTGSVGGRAVWGDGQCGGTGSVGGGQCGGRAVWGSVGGRAVWGGGQCGGGGQCVGDGQCGGTGSVGATVHVYIQNPHATYTYTYDRNCTHTHLAN